MSLCFPLLGNQLMTINSVYPTTLQAEPVTKKTFYRELKSLLLKIDNRDHTVWPGVLGHHRVCNCNDNRHMLLEFCMEHGLTITNTLFQQKDNLNLVKDNLQVFTLHALAPPRLHPCMSKRCQLLHRPQAGSSKNPNQGHSEEKGTSDQETQF